MMWNIIVSMAYWDRVNLSAQALYRQPGTEAAIEGLEYRRDGKQINQFIGFSYNAACVEVEIDVLTGESSVLRADLVEDVGESLNPALDVGQIEGAFVQGLGYMVTEELVIETRGEQRGALRTLNVGTYKIPAVSTVPRQFNVELLPRERVAHVAENPHLVLSSKHVGEPPLLLAVAAYLAIKRAVLAARADRGRFDWFTLEAPATPPRVRAACLVDAADLTLRGRRGGDL